MHLYIIYVCVYIYIYILICTCVSFPDVVSEDQRQFEDAPEEAARSTRSR